MNFLESYFKLNKNSTSIKTEIIAGLTTFLTMSYIILLQPLILSGKIFGKPTGMDFGGVMFATCLSAGITTIIMGLYANYPVALAPGMGENFFFAVTVIPFVISQGIEKSWQTALGIVFISGILFFIITLLNLREKVVDAISSDMKNAIAVGIGIFIAFIGLHNAGIIVGNPGTLVSLNHNFNSPEIYIFFAGLIITAGLHSRKIKGAIILGIVFSALLCFLGGIAGRIYNLPFLQSLAEKIKFDGHFSLLNFPKNAFSTVFKLDIMSALKPSFLHLILVLLFMDIFDTLGTFIGVAEQMNVVKDNKIPRIKKAMFTDAFGTVFGSLLGTSTVTSYIESSAGIEEGGKTGLTAVIVGLLFIVSLFFYPIVNFLSSFPIITSPALVIVGSMMIGNVSKINWKDYSESIPAFMVIIGIPLSFSISDGLALGLIIYPFIKYLAGKRSELNLFHWGLSLVFIARYVL